MKATTSIRLFVDAHVFDGPYQGTRTFISCLYAEVAKHEGIVLYIAAYDTKALEISFGKATNIVYLAYKSRSKYKRLLWEIPRLIREHKINYAHFQYITPLHKNCRFIVTTHDVIFQDIPEYFSSFYRFQKKWLYKYSASKADILTTVSEHAKQSIAKHLFVDQHKIHVVPNGIRKDLDFFITTETAKKYVKEKYGFDNYLLFVSRIEPRKNHLLLVWLFRNLQLAEKGYQLVFIGSDTCGLQTIKRKSTEWLGEHVEKVVFLKDVSDDELLLLYKTASLFIYPSKGEGFGIPPLEAAAMEIPVLCSNAAALKDFDFFENDHLDPADETAFANRLSHLLSNPTDKEVLKKRAHLVSQKYSWEKSAATFCNLIKKHHLNTSLL